MHRDRHHHVQVVALSTKHRMRGDSHSDVEIAGGTAVQAGIAFRRDPQPVAVRDTRWNPDDHAFAASFLTGPRARLAGPGRLLAGSSAAAARAREHHVSTHRAHRARPQTEVTRTGTRTRPPATGAAATVFAARHRDRPLNADQGLLERHLHLDVQVRAALLRGRAPPTLGEHLGEQIAERRRVIRAARREVEALEPRCLTSLCRPRSDVRRRTATAESDRSRSHRPRESA